MQVAEAAAVSASFSLDASKYKRAPHKNKFGKDYASARSTEGAATRWD